MYFIAVNDNGVGKVIHKNEYAQKYFKPIDGHEVYANNVQEASRIMLEEFGEYYIPSNEAVDFKNPYYIEFFNKYSSKTNEKTRNIWEELKTELMNPDFNFPIDIKNFLKEEEVISYNEESLEEKGNVCFSDNKFCVTINKEKEEYVQNFTAAHELGHIILHATDIIEKNGEVYQSEYKEKTNLHDQKEIEANVFAAELLVPAFRLKEIIDKEGELGEVLNIASNEFKVREQVIRYRLSNLGLLLEI